MYADSISKQFLNYANPTAAAGAQDAGALKDSVIADHQDPTYMGFQIRLVPSLNVTNDYDSLPHGLFASPDPVLNVYSTYNYLYNRGETLRASYILEFERSFIKLVQQCPWFFVKVTGLADAWKIDPGNNFRGKDKKIVIETLESIDMKMTYLMDLYRKATYDYTWMRWAVPDHMRYFKMDIIVSEVRPMKISTVAYGASKYPGIPNTDASNFEDSIAGMRAGEENVQGLYDTTAIWSSGTFVKFRFEQCEFDFMSEAPTFLESVSNVADTMATNKITIKTNVIRERNVYGLLGAIIEDTATALKFQQRTETYGYPHSTNGTPSTQLDPNEQVQAQPFTNYSQGFRDRASAQANFNAENGVQVVQSSQVPAGTDVGVGDNVLGPGATTNTPANLGNAAFTSDQSQAGGPGGKNGGLGNSNLGKSAVQNKLSNAKAAVAGAAKNATNNLITGAKAALSDAVNKAINKALLGNVYGLSPLSIIGSAQSIINNPVAAIQNLLKKHSSPGIGKVLAGRVSLTGQEIQLVKDIIGKTVEDNINVNPDLVKDNGKTNLASANIIKSNPGSANLVAPNVTPATKQKTNLTSFAKAGKIQSKVMLEGTPPTQNPLGNVGLEGAPPETGNLGNVGLE
jgi:hypothetical protein